MASGLGHLKAFAPGTNIDKAFRRLSAPDIQDKLADLENLLSKQSDGLSTDLTSLAKGAEDILTKTDGSIIDVAGCYRCFDCTFTRRAAILSSFSAD